MKPLYGAEWRFVGESDLMVDELGHSRHAHKVPCFLGGRLHSRRYLGQDVRHCVTMDIYVCVYCGREKAKTPKER